MISRIICDWKQYQVLSIGRDVVVLDKGVKHNSLSPASSVSSSSSLYLNAVAAEFHRIEHPCRIECMTTTTTANAPGGHVMIVTGGGDGVVRLFAHPIDVSASSSTVAPSAQEAGAAITVDMQSNQFQAAPQALVAYSEIRVSATPVRAIAFSPGARMMLVGNLSGELKLWNTSTMKIKESKKFKTACSALAFSKNDPLFCCVGMEKDLESSLNNFPAVNYNKMLMFADGALQKEAGSLSVHVDTVAALAISHTENCLPMVASGSTGRVVVSNSSGKQIFVRDLASSTVAATALCFSPDSRTLIVGCSDGTVAWFHTPAAGSAAPTVASSSLPSSPVRSAPAATTTVTSPVATANSASTSQSPPAGAAATTANVAPSSFLTAKVAKAVTTVQQQQQQKQQQKSAAGSPTASAFSASSPAASSELAGGGFNAHAFRPQFEPVLLHPGSAVTAIAISTERLICTGDDSGRLEISSAVTGQRLASAPHMRGAVTGIAFVPSTVEGALMIAASSTDGFLRFYHVARGSLLLHFQVVNAQCISLRMEGGELPSPLQPSSDKTPAVQQQAPKKKNKAAAAGAAVQPSSSQPDSGTHQQPNAAQPSPPVAAAASSPTSSSTTVTALIGTLVKKTNASSSLWWWQMCECKDDKGKLKTIVFEPGPLRVVDCSILDAKKSLSGLPVGAAEKEPIVEDIASLKKRIKELEDENAKLKTKCCC